MHGDTPDLWHAVMAPSRALIPLKYLSWSYRHASGMMVGISACFEGRSSPPGWAASVQVVPTIYVNSHNHTISSNQYSVTEHFKVAYDYQVQLPGVFFYYDLSPIKV